MLKVSLALTLNTGEEVIRRPSEKEPFAALAFKIATDPFVGRLCFIRVYSGNLEAGSYVYNMRSENKERISRIFQMHANKQNPIPNVGAGDIAAVVGFKDIKTGDTLCDEKHPIILESMNFPEPVIGLAIEPKTQADVDKLGMALGKLSEEDPTFRVNTDEETGQTVISGMGELHLDIIMDRLKREFKVEVNQGAPQVAYKEAITGTIQHRETYKKQTGGRGKFADIQVIISPNDEGKEGLQFVNEISGVQRQPEHTRGRAGAWPRRLLGGRRQEAVRREDLSVGGRAGGLQIDQPALDRASGRGPPQGQAAARRGAPLGAVLTARTRPSGRKHEETHQRSAECGAGVPGRAGSGARRHPESLPGPGVRGAG